VEAFLVNKQSDVVSIVNVLTKKTTTTECFDRNFCRLISFIIWTTVNQFVVRIYL